MRQMLPEDLRWLNLTLFYRRLNIPGVGMQHMMVPNGYNGRRVTAPHTRRTHHSHLGGISSISQCLMQRLCSRHTTGKRATHP